MDTAVDPGMFVNYVPLNALKSESQQELAKKTVLSEAKAGQFLFRAGEAAKTAIYVMQGDVALEDSTGKAIGKVSGGTPNSFHRLAHQSPRKVAAKCLTAVRYMAVDASLLDVMLTWDQTGTFEVGELSAQEVDSGDWMAKLLQMRTFQMVPPSNLQAMFMRMQEVKATPGEVVVQQGSDGDFFYVLMEGRAIVTREQAAGQKPIKLAELEAGSCFGEEALISDSKRNATVTMLTHSRLMRLSKDDFRNLLNDPLSRRMSFADADKMVKSGKAKWLDVRLPSEFQNASLPGAINLPLYILRLKLSTLDAKTAYVCCCDTGRRSSVAVFVLTQKGFEAYVLDKGIPQPAGV
ncbi:MAG TPA: cyclic nucleotide-binding domain-containing protein [Candidatus Binatia bacterium]|nr:cyclic nucleotide-binding domain-containing protein [Candidatus Binatia bacterium]